MPALKQRATAIRRWVGAVGCTRLVVRGWIEARRRWCDARAVGPLAMLCGALLAACSPASPPAAGGTVGDAARGQTALHQHACNACHVIPGITGADVHIGPPLAGIARRQLLAGKLPNTPENMVRWIRDPRSVERWTAMPDLGVSQRDATDMAAYLATLR